MSNFEEAFPLPRRDFLRLAGLAAAGMALPRSSAWGEPAGSGYFDYPLIPSDKNLSKEWLASLTSRGKPTIYNGAALKNIGMPVGGFCTGQVNLGGDGKLWLWDVFNEKQVWGMNYAEPVKPTSPLNQGFAIRVNGATRTLDQAGFPDVTFLGQYPIGTVTYQAADCPVRVVLEAYSPFIPLDPEDSGLPATVLEYTIRNVSEKPVEGEIGGWLENAVCQFTPRVTGIRTNRISKSGGVVALHASAKNAPPEAADRARVDIVFADFEGKTYAGWKTSGDAFGSGPAQKSDIPPYQNPETMGIVGVGAVNSHASATGDIAAREAAVGNLTSEPFTVQRRYVRFLIGGGAFPEELAFRMLLDGKTVRTAAGGNSHVMREEMFDVREFEGRMATFEVMDQRSAGLWAHIGVDQIVFTDAPGVEVPAECAADFGTMSLALLSSDALATADIGSRITADALFEALSGARSDELSRPIPDKLVGGVTQRFSLPPGAEKKVTFIISWHFPSVRYVGVMQDGWDRLQDYGKLRRYYAKRFADAGAVISYLTQNFDRLSGHTKKWRDTWYDSTLPHWLLDRTLQNISILATATCHRFDNGRYWFWEGAYSCNGTCTHVWSYAQAIGRLFPQIERDLRERVDYGIGFVEDTGMILMRAETYPAQPATDGQAGTVLRTLREHQMSPDRSFLERVWPRVQKAVQWLIDQDENEDGAITGYQLHTLDQPWFGHIAWISGLYVAALKAGEKMALEMGDSKLATRWAAIAEKGSRRISEDLFHKDQYFIQKPPPDKITELGSGFGCEIDQVFGQSWAFQVGLGRILPEDQTRKALHSLWRYNFAPDVGPFRKGSPIPDGRWFAMPGEGGLVICTFPDPDHSKPVGDGFHAFYFNECMTGFEYQVAAHMIWEGGDLLEKGLAITKTVHDRYDASKRNPWNEVEAGNHYGRSMAGYGVFVAVCGFEYDGPKQHIGFAPRLPPHNFRAPFTAAEGWGTFRQKINGGKIESSLEVKSGKLPLKSLSLEAPGSSTNAASAQLNGIKLECKLVRQGARVKITFAKSVIIEAGQTLTVTL